MRKLKILVSADWHLDSPWEALSSAQARELREKAREIPRQLARIAREEQADLILLPGDLFDSERPYLESARELEGAFEDLNIPVFIAPGNHDCFSAGSPWESLSLPDNVYVFRKNSLECVRLEKANIFGAAFTEPVCPNAMANLFAKAAGDKFNILLLHADLGGSGAYRPISERALAASGFDFAALGHIHRPSGLKKAGDTWYCYPGCSMGRGFDECGERGAMLITLTEDGCTGSLIELSDRRYERIEVCVTGKDPLDALSAAVDSAREEDICRFELTGVCESAPKQSTLDRLAKERGLYAAFLKDKTVPPLDSDGVTLKSTLLKIASQRMETADEAEKAEIAAALRWALAALDGAEAPEEVAQ